MKTYHDITCLSVTTDDRDNVWAHAQAGDDDIITFYASSVERAVDMYYDEHITQLSREEVCMRYVDDEPLFLVKPEKNELSNLTHRTRVNCGMPAKKLSADRIALCLLREQQRKLKVEADATLAETERLNKLADSLLL